MDIGMEILDHPFRAYKPSNGGYAGGVRKGDAQCEVCGVRKSHHRRHDYYGYGHGDCMYCYEKEHSTVHEYLQKRLI